MIGEKPSPSPSRCGLASLTSLLQNESTPQPLRRMNLSHGGDRTIMPHSSRSRVTTRAAVLALLAVAALIVNVSFPRVVRFTTPPDGGYGSSSSSSSSRHSSSQTTTTTTLTTTATEALPCPVPSMAASGATTTTTTTSATEQPQEGRPTFVFVAGLEGTGHHLHELLVRDSPSFATLTRLGLIEPTRSVSELLFAGMGLMTAHCLELSPRVPLPPTNATNRCAKLDTSCLFRETVRELRHIRSVAAASNESFAVYVNANAILAYSMASYPSLLQNCRPLSYPVMDFFYDACTKASVECRHIYIYRDPLEILKSSQRRKYNKGAIVAMQLYTTMLKVLRTQFLDHPTRTAGCFGLYEDNATYTEKWEPMSRLLGWPTLVDFQRSVQAVYVPPTPVSAELQAALIPSYSKRFAAPYVRAFHAMLDLCRDQVAAANTAGCPTESSYY